MKVVIMVPEATYSHRDLWLICWKLQRGIASWCW